MRSKVRSASGFSPFWLRVEPRLDDEADVPADPAADGSMLARIRAICANAAT